MDLSSYGYNMSKTLNFMMLFFPLLAILAVILWILAIVFLYYDRITGGKVSDYYSSFMADKKWNGVVDVTNELPRFGNSKHYVNVPAWDGCPPPVEGIQQAVDFIMSTDKPILIHCAYEL